MSFEVYDDPQPSSGIEVAAVEALSAGPRVVLAVVWVRHGRQDGIDVIEEVGPAEREMLLAPCVEHDAATIEIANLGIVSQGTTAKDGACRCGRGRLRVERPGRTRLAGGHRRWLETHVIEEVAVAGHDRVGARCASWATR